MPTAKQKAKLNPVKLTEIDEATVVTAASTFARKVLHSTQPTAVSFDDAVQNVVSNLQKTLSADGYQRLLVHVRSEKQFMKIFPFPQMSGH